MRIENVPLGQRQPHFPAEVSDIKPRVQRVSDAKCTQMFHRQLMKTIDHLL